MNIGRHRHPGVNSKVDEEATKQARERHKLGQQVLDFWFGGILGRDARKIMEANRVEAHRRFPSAVRQRRRAANKAARISRRRNRKRR